MRHIGNKFAPVGALEQPVTPAGCRLSIRTKAYVIPLVSLALEDDQFREAAVTMGGA